MLNDPSRQRMARFALQTWLCALLWSCGGGSSDAPPPSPPPDAALSISTSSLPHGQAGHAYAATLTASGGTAPLSWTLTGGTLPAGLTLAANGVDLGHTRRDRRRHIADLHGDRFLRHRSQQERHAAADHQSRQHQRDGITGSCRPHRPPDPQPFRRHQRLCRGHLEQRSGRRHVQRPGQRERRRGHVHRAGDRRGVHGHRHERH